MGNYCDLKALRSFLLVADEGGISIAARRLGVTQSAVSKHIALLERHYSVALVQRDGRGTRLTAAGSILAENGRRVLDRIDAFAKLASEQPFPDPPEQVVHLGLSPTVSEIVLPDLLMKLAERAPEIRLRVSEAFSSTVESWLLHGRVDAGVIYQSAGGRGFDIQSSHVDRLAIVVGAMISTARPTELVRSAAFVLPASPNGLRQIVDAQLLSQGVTLAVRHEIGSYGAMKKLAMQGVAATILPLNVVEQEIRSGMLKEVIVPGLFLRRTLVVARRGDSVATEIQNIVLKELGVLLDRACG